MKYSIIIPCRNGGAYLPTCVETVLSQNFQDYELIISNDHSEDGTEEYLSSLNNEKVKKFIPPSGLSMAEHWEWALAKASGEWIIFVGQDDGLQSYFFELADRLVAIAEAKKLRAIMSERAYFFWPGYENKFGKQAIIYRGVNFYEERSSFYQAIMALLGLQDYFELPQMYTTSLFKKALIDEAIQIQGGRLFTTHPQDANLAAICISLEKTYLQSHLPLGWVGTSPKSAGMAIGQAGDTSNSESHKAIERLRKDYLEKTKNSKLQCHNWIGDFSLDSLQLYFWGACLKSERLQDKKLQNFFRHKVLKFLIFSFAYANLKSEFDSGNELKKRLFFEQIRLMKIRVELIKIVSPGIKGIKFIFRFLKKLRSFYLFKRYPSFKYRRDRTDNLFVKLNEESLFVSSKVNNFFK